MKTAVCNTIAAAIHRGVKNKYPETIAVILNGTAYQSFNQDAITIAEKTGIPYVREEGTEVTEFPADNLNHVLLILTRCGYAVAIARDLIMHAPSGTPSFTISSTQP